MPTKQDRVKSIFWIILDIALAAGAILILVSANALWRYGKSLYPARVINVSAEGKVVVSPDIANLSFSVVSQGKDPEKLQNDNNVKINNALDFIKSEGVDPKDIKTADYNLSPNYRYDEKRGVSSIDGYTLSQTVLVKIRDLGKAGKILVGLPSRGINQIGGLNFSIENPDKFLNEARKEAFAKARAKAEAMAEQNDMKIKGVVTFNEYGGGYPGPIYMRAEAFGKGGDVAPTPAPPSIEPGSQEVTIQVNVTYEIR